MTTETHDRPHTYNRARRRPSFWFYGARGWFLYYTASARCFLFGHSLPSWSNDMWHCYRCGAERPTTAED